MKGFDLISPKELGLTAEDDGSVLLKQVHLKLPPKERAVLHLLITKWPAAVTKTAFAAQIWKGTMSDESLVRCVAQIRRAISGLYHIEIAAIYGQGYRLQTKLSMGPGQMSAMAHNRLHRGANSENKSAEAITHSRNLIYQRTTSSLSRAEAILRKVISECPGSDPARRVFAECISAQVSCGWGLQKSSIHEALDVLDGIPEASRADAGYYSEKAHLLDCAWEFDSAGSYHSFALASGKEDAATHYHHAWHLLARNEPHPAIDALTQALDLAPFSAALAIMLARAHTFVGQTDKGLKILEQAVADHPGSTMVYIYFLTYQAFIRPTDDIAAKLLELTDNDLTWSFAPSSLVYALARCGETKKARTLLEANLHHNPSMRATFTSGMLLLGLKNQALDCLSEAAALGCGFLPISLRAPENQGLADHEAYRELQNIVFSRV